MKKTMQIDGCNLILLIEIAQTDCAEINFHMKSSHWI